jgi:hypothetical protein
MSKPVSGITFAAMLLITGICLWAYFVNDKVKPLCDALLHFVVLPAAFLGAGVYFWKSTHP